SAPLAPHRRRDRSSGDGPAHREYRGAQRPVLRVARVSGRLGAQDTDLVREQLIQQPQAHLPNVGDLTCPGGDDGSRRERLGVAGPQGVLDSRPTARPSLEVFGRALGVPEERTRTMRPYSPIAQRWSASWAVA